MKKTVHKILGIKSQPVFYEVSVNHEACSSNRSEFLQSPASRVTSEQRVDFVMKYFTVRITDQNESKKFCKNATVAGKLRERGNEFYKKKDFGNALKYYNVAIMFAPSGDQEAGLAYANRSAVLVELGHPEEALMDVELALLNNYPKASVCKLESRRIKCNEKIQRRDAIRNEKDRKLRIHVEEEISKRKKMRKEMLHIGNPNPRIPEAANFVTIEYDQAMGRKLMVTQDVPAGTVLNVSDPYVTVLNNEDGWTAEHCHHCLRRIRRGIPCPNCVFAFYCSEACRQEAEEEYHKFECPCTDYLNVEEQSAVLAFRAVCKAGPKKLFQLYQSRDPSYFSPKAPYGTEEGCKFNEDPYLAVYHMKTHSEKLNEADEAHAGRTYSAIILSVMLESRSAFFREIPQIQRTGFKKFLAALIRHHIDSVYVNPTPVYEMSGLDGISLADFYSDESVLEGLSCRMESSEPVPYAFGIYPLDSLKNHSCDSNVYFVDDVSKGRKINIALRALKAGDVIYGSYAEDFTYEPLELRQQALKDYHFTCQCIACVNKWPTMPAGAPRHLSPFAQFCCPICSGKYSTEEKASAEFKMKCGLNEAGSWKCSSCGKQYHRETLQALLDANIMLFEQADQLSQLNRVREAVVMLNKVVEFCQIQLCPPSYVQIWAERRCFHAMCLLFHFLRQ